LLELIGQLLRRGDDLESAWRLVDDARKCVSPHVWASAAEQLADVLRSDPSAAWRECAGEMYVELARVYRVELNDLDVAADFLASAGQLAGGNTILDQAVQAEVKAWEESIELLEGVRKWRDGMLEVRRKELRKHLQGKRAIFVGGLERGFDVEHIRTQLALERADFVPHFHTERGKLDTIPPRIRQGQVDYVIDFIAFGAHRNLEDDCKEHDVKYVRVPRGRSLDQIVRALADLHGVVL